MANKKCRKKCRRMCRNKCRKCRTTIYDDLRQFTTIYDNLRQSTTIYDNLRQLRQFTTIYMRQSLTNDDKQIRAQQFNLLAYSHQELLYLSLHDVVHSGR